MIHNFFKIYFSAVFVDILIGQFLSHTENSCKKLDSHSSFHLTLPVTIPDEEKKLTQIFVFTFSAVTQNAS